MGAGHGAHFQDRKEMTKLQGDREDNGELVLGVTGEIRNYGYANGPTRFSEDCCLWRNAYPNAWGDWGGELGED